MQRKKKNIPPERCSSGSECSSWFYCSGQSIARAWQIHVIVKLVWKQLEGFCLGICKKSFGFWIFIFPFFNTILVVYGLINIF
ncbi:hypothetical protein HN873_004145 [Arachis hypogaea]